MKLGNYIKFCTKFYENLYQRRKNDLSIIKVLSHIYASTGNKKRCLKMSQRHVHLEPLNPVAHYNLACDLSVGGKPEGAINALETAFVLGYRDLQWLYDDIDLDPIRHNKAFKALLERHFCNTAPQ